MEGWALAFMGLSYGAHSNLCINQIRRWANAEQKARYLPGRIIAVDVAPGSAVTKGTKLLTLKAMKMEHGRTVTETDNLLFSVMTHDPQPLHIDAEAAKASAFAQILVNGTFTFALMIGLSVGDTMLGALIANPGYDKLLMPRPVFLGDTLRARSEVVELRESGSRPGAGLITFRHEMHNQRDEIVCPCLRTALIRRSAAPVD